MVEERVLFLPQTQMVAASTVSKDRLGTLLTLTPSATERFVHMNWLRPFWPLDTELAQIEWTGIHAVTPSDFFEEFGIEVVFDLGLFDAFLYSDSGL